MKRVQTVISGHPHLFYAALSALIGALLYFFAVGMKPLGMGFFALSATILFFLLLKCTAVRFPKLSHLVRSITVYLLLLFLLAFAVTTVMLISDARTSPEPEADYLLVLGAQVVGTQPSGVLSDRLEAALPYLQAYPQATAIVTGGQGPDEGISEAQCMYNWLTERGIDPQRIWLEERATRTAENVVYARDMIAAETEDMENVSVAVLTSEFHLMRAKLLANWAGLDVRGVAAPSANRAVLVSNCFREVFAVWNSFLFDRHVVQALLAS